ncbi:MAG: glycosyltransferase family 4 protein [Proteobacteria bacterium]|nr:glycosyltransferase family 4 protein [Pseudomonadota bacterium]
MTTARRRLLFVSPLPPPTGGISNWMVAVQASALRERFEIHVVNSSPSAEHVVAVSKLRGRRIFDAVRILARVVVELVRFRPDVVHVNTSYFWAFLRDGLTIRLARLAGARTVLHVRGGDFPDWAEGSGAAARSFIRATLRRTDMVVALTEHTQRWLEEEVGADRVRYLPNFVRLDAIGPPPDRSGRSGGPVEVLFVGWCLEAKGVRELLAAARQLPEIRFTLVGPQEPIFTATIQDELRALGDRVRALPAQSREEIFRLYREADVFVLPTWREGFPNVVIEAMAAGLPVVATPVGAIPEAIEDGRSGLLVPVRDATALEHALRRLASDPALRQQIGACARARVEAVFSFDAVVARLEAIYQEILV